MALPGCAVLAQQLGEPASGTASSIRSWLLLEQRGAWTGTAREDVLARALSADRLSELDRVRERDGLRPLLIRRPGRARSGPLTVLMASSRAGRSWVERRLVDDLREVADLDLAQLGAGEPGQGEPVPDAVYLVCTHGAKDLCCAVQGRPVAAALSAVAPGAVWECTHLGGHRFAANVAVLPDGLVYGQVPVDRVTEIALAHDDGRLVPDLLRGRTRDAPPVQAAEIALRRARGLTRLDDVTVLGTQAVEGGVLVRLDACGETVDQVVDEVALGCRGVSACSGESAPTVLRARPISPAARRSRS